MISRYSVQQISNIFSDENKYSTWLKIQLLLLEFLQSKKIISSESFIELTKKLEINVSEINAEEALTRHDFAAFMNVISKKATNKDKKWLHFGLTTTDVVDTANSLLIKEANEILIKKLNHLQETLKTLAYKYKDLPQIGRTHGVHAEITSFGYKFAIFYDDMEKNIENFYRLRKNIECVMMSGSVGTYAHTGIELQNFVAKKLELHSSDCSMQTLSRERYADYINSLNMIGQTINKISVYLRFLNTTEINEINESFKDKQVGSSSMPHKKNPITLENICGLARIIRSYHSPALDNIPLWFERDISHSSVERIIIPDAITLTYQAIDKLDDFLNNMFVNEKQILKNIDLTHNRIYSQSAMLRIIEKNDTERKIVHKEIQKIVNNCAQNNLCFKQELLKNDIAKSFTEKDIQEIFDPFRHLKHMDFIYKNIFKNNEMQNCFKKIVWNKHQIFHSMSLMSQWINSYYQDETEEVVVLALLNGATVFAGHLLPLLSFKIIFLNVHCSFYGDKTSVNEDAKQNFNLDPEIFKNKKVLIIDDLIDVGKTLFEIKKEIQKFNVKEIKTAVLFKKTVEKPYSTVDWFGLEIPNEWAAGFGIDSKKKYRNLNWLGILKPEFY